MSLHTLSALTKLKSFNGGSSIIILISLSQWSEESLFLKDVVKECRTLVSYRRHMTANCTWISIFLGNLRFSGNLSSTDSFGSSLWDCCPVRNVIFLLISSNFYFFLGMALFIWLSLVLTINNMMNSPQKNENHAIDTLINVVVFRLFYNRYQSKKRKTLDVSERHECPRCEY